MIGKLMAVDRIDCAFIWHAEIRAVCIALANVLQYSFQVKLLIR